MGEQPGAENPPVPEPFAAPKYKELLPVFFKGTPERQLKSVYKTRETKPERVAEYRRAIHRGDCSPPAVDVKLSAMFDALDIVLPEREPCDPAWHVKAHEFLEKELGKMDAKDVPPWPDPWLLANKAKETLGLDLPSVIRCFLQRQREGEDRENAKDRARMLAENPGKHFDAFGCLVSDEPEPDDDMWRGVHLAA